MPFRPRVALRDELAFLLTNRIPRRAAASVMRRFSRIESRRLAHISIAVWRQFARDLDLDEAETREFTSVHACFTRRLRAGARPIDASPDVIVSPCDGIVGAYGRIDGLTLVQAKGLTYTLPDLLQCSALTQRLRDGSFVTMRLTPSMYHRFHAPCEGTLVDARVVAGDVWNVNPISVRRIERLFCRNERAVLPITPRDSTALMTLVPVAAILVGGIRVHHVPGATFDRGEELGYFEHGSTIVALASHELTLAESVVEGSKIRMGQPLFRFTPGTIPNLQPRPR